MNQHKAILLPRLLSLKDRTPFILVLDTIAQSADFFVEELLHRSKADATVWIKYEHGLVSPKHKTMVVEGTGKSCQEVIGDYEKLLPPIEGSDGSSPSGTVLVLVDTLAYIPHSQLLDFLTRLLRPNVTLVAIHHLGHGDYHDTNPYYPSTLSLLTYFSTTTISLAPKQMQESHKFDLEAHEREVDRFLIPVLNPSNCSEFEVNLVHSRRSGRSVTADYLVDVRDHTIELIHKAESKQITEETPEILQGLSTFNLATSDRQKEARDAVDLPFLATQHEGQGGAIVYEFEKDDDYDEEDPYEDPF